MGGKKQLLTMSFHDLMEGVGKGHRIAAAQPGAMKIDPQIRRDIVKNAANRGDVLREYNARELLGPGIEVRPGAHNSNEREELQFFRNGNPIGTPSGGTHSYATIYNKDPFEFRNDPAAGRLMERTGNRDPLEFNTMGMPKGLGSNAYQMLWDMQRGDKRANVVDILTGINQMRRPGNLMSVGLTHGDLGNAQMFPGSSYAGFPLEETGLGGMKREGAEKASLYSLLPTLNQRETALATRPLDFERYTRDAQIGALGLRELQMAKAHGSMDPNYLGAPLGEHRLTGLMHPMDADQIKYATDVARREGTRAYSTPYPDDLANAFGTGLMGRAATTEALMRGIQYGHTPEEIMEDLLRYRGAQDALKGRYAKGGAIHAAIAD
jgi:hypothetical protein